MSQPSPGPVTPAQREIADAIGRMLPLLDPDGARADLVKTPQRVARSLTYLTSGYGQDVRAMLEGATFESDSDEMVLVKDIEVYSLCEHHLLPFFGRAHVAYLPDRRIVGLSKLARVVDVFARRLQVQERMTTQIAAALQETLQPRGVGVLIEAQHLCMMMRGVEKQNSSTTTSCMLGRFRSDPKTRQEFLELVKR